MIRASRPTRTGLAIRGNNGTADVFKTSINANITVTGGTTPTIALGSRTFTFLGFDYPEVVDYKPRQRTRSTPPSPIILAAD